MAKLLKPLKRDRRGATAIEYSLIVGLIGLAAAGVASGLGGDLVQIYQSIEGSFETARNG